MLSQTLVHYFHTQSSPVKDVCPGRNNTILTVDQRLVEIKSVKVEGHGANTKSSEPDSHYRPGSQEEVE
jgi:hypothetical protein